MATFYSFLRSPKFFFFLILGVLLPAFRYVVLHQVQGNATDLTPYPDFMTHWAAAKVALNGLGAEIYNHADFIAVARSLIPNFLPLPQIHPPTYLAILSPFTFLNVDIGMLLWTILTVFFFALTLHLKITNQTAWLIAMSSPILIWTITWGQIGCFLAAIFGLFALYIDRRPWFAALCVALLAVKPNLAILFPFVFLIDKRWYLFGLTTIFLLAFCSLSVFLFGVETWKAFFIQGIAEQQEVLKIYSVWGWEHQQSLYGFIRFCGLSHQAALSIHIAFAIPVVILALSVWKSRLCSQLKVATLAVSSVAITPYCHVHDLAFLVMASTILWQHHKKHGVSSPILGVLIAALLAPFLVALGYPGGLLSIGLMLFLTVHTIKSANPAKFTS